MSLLTRSRNSEPVWVSLGGLPTIPLYLKPYAWRRLLTRKSAFYDHIMLQLNPWKQAQANQLHARLKRSSGKKCDWRFSGKEGPSWLGSIWFFCAGVRGSNSQPICPKTCFKDVQLDHHKASSIPFYLRGFIPPQAWNIDLYSALYHIVLEKIKCSKTNGYAAMRASFQDCNFHWVNLQNTSDLDVLDMDMAGQGHPWSTSTQGGAHRQLWSHRPSPVARPARAVGNWWQLELLYHFYSFLGQSEKATLLITRYTLCCKPLWLYSVVVT